jgi:hypothetical protein
MEVKMDDNGSKCDRIRMKKKVSKGVIVKRKRLKEW